MTIPWSEIWPPFGLRVRCGPVELTVPRDEDVPGLVALVRDGIHDADRMPFYVPWTRVSPDELPANYARYIWQQRAGQTSGGGNVGLEFVVRHEGEMVGMQGFGSSSFGVTRTGETGSWLAQRFQGRGIGTLMRQTICAFAFDHLGAERVTSGAFLDNPASLAVSRKVGYQLNGVVHLDVDGVCAANQKTLLTPATFVRPPHPLEVEGVEAYLRFAGLDG